MPDLAPGQAAVGECPQQEAQEFRLRGAGLWHQDLLLAEHVAYERSVSRKAVPQCSAATSMVAGVSRSRVSSSHANLIAWSTSGTGPGNAIRTASRYSRARSSTSLPIPATRTFCAPALLARHAVSIRLLLETPRRWTGRLRRDGPEPPHNARIGICEATIAAEPITDQIESS